ncbi:uncharacterized protein ACLA_043820 [Aspergillus clavatus NRRL 1]|uniref:Nucleoside phosphorylase domain-containing protein n=1 Tax=Aspergillus clavatus (strain ATCC 1007 / CBS 513.65 / DSM 816 / NCTC 3887 / NRRL 1 / QM 1276 / 107) TaxID=344612 RepID=A1C8M5_ASPCL|nr:uncharacterized protein ACLA_043820 [Aspergillus clavatus NRRL 1]EAW13662.1 conserved hypothetical protein [Aspergillus clavatus NRRL 1]
MSQNPRTHDDYTMGWVCVTLEEQITARIMLDNEHEDLQASPGDDNIYILGQMGKHNVAIVRPPTPQGLSKDILLGDVVVSEPKGKHSGVLQYDMVKRFEDRCDSASHLDKPPQVLTSAAQKLACDHAMNKGEWKDYIHDSLQKLQSFGIAKYSFPGRQQDLLYRSGYHHLKDREDCSACDPGQIVPRSLRDEPHVHYGLIASGNTLVRSAMFRDQMAKEQEVLCFEMEAAGLMNGFPCIVIRGICDYADSHKNDLWQPYASVTAAAYAKDLLRLIQPQEVHRVELAASLMLRCRSLE